ncbi:MAG: BcsR/BcsP family cellulose biosynthesis protein [Myxococcota bacterium]
MRDSRRSSNVGREEFVRTPATDPHSPPAGDVAELFEQAGVEDLAYRELAAPQRAAEALERWPLVRATLSVLGRSYAAAEVADSHDAAAFFRGDRR